MSNSEGKQSIWDRYTQQKTHLSLGKRVPPGKRINALSLTWLSEMSLEVRKRQDAYRTQRQK